VSPIRLLVNKKQKIVSQTNGKNKQDTHILSKTKQHLSISVSLKYMAIKAKAEKLLIDARSLR